MKYVANILFLRQYIIYIGLAPGIFCRPLKEVVKSATKSCLKKVFLLCNWNGHDLGKGGKWFF